MGIVTRIVHGCVRNLHPKAECFCSLNVAYCCLLALLSLSGITKLAVIDS